MGTVSTVVSGRMRWVVVAVVLRTQPVRLHPSLGPAPRAESVSLLDTDSPRCWPSERAVSPSTDEASASLDHTADRVAPLVASAADLSVLGLLLGVRYLALNDAP